MPTVNKFSKPFKSVIDSLDVIFIPLVSIKLLKPIKPVNLLFVVIPNSPSNFARLLKPVIATRLLLSLIYKFPQEGSKSPII